MKNVLGIVISFVYIIMLMISAKYFEKFDKEASRKYIHILLANWWLIAMAFFDNVIWAVIPPIAFVIINYISYKGNVIKVMEREDDDQNGLGTVYFAFSLIPLVILSFGIAKNPLVGLAGFFVMTYGDGFAAIVGKSIESKEMKIFGDTKTIAGSMAMFVMSMIILLCVFAYSGTEMIFIKSFVISLVATVLELVSIKGTDNVTVPILTSVLAFWMI